MQDSETLEIADLESLFSDELHCEATRVHDPRGKWYVPCSHSVTHRATNCTGSANVCLNTAERSERNKARGHVCIDCRRPASLCWRIVPI